LSGSSATRTGAVRDSWQRVEAILVRVARDPPKVGLVQDADEPLGPLFALSRLPSPAEDITQDDATRTVVAHLPDRGATVGTIAYMSAEQALGQTNLTAQSDQFSLGLVLYELAAGRRAFPRQRG